MTDAPETPDLQRSNRWRELREGTYGGLFAACAVASVLTTVAIVLTLLVDATSFFASYSPIEFLTGFSWSPRNGVFGVEIGRAHV